MIKATEANKAFNKLCQFLSPHAKDVDISTVVKFISQEMNVQDILKKGKSLTSLTESEATKKYRNRTYVSLNVAVTGLPESGLYTIASCESLDGNEYPVMTFRQDNGLAALSIWLEDDTLMREVK